MSLKFLTFGIAGLIGLLLSWTGYVEILFSIELAIVRGIIALWALEFGARIARAVVDSTRPTPSVSELIDRLTSTLVSGVSLYILLAVWLAGTAIFDGMFSAQPYAMLASFLKMGSSFTAALWLLLNCLAFLTGGRKEAHEFLTSLKGLALNLAERDAEHASDPIEDYQPHHEPR